MSTLATKAVEYPVEPEFLEQILSPYANKDCVYLRAAVTEVGANGVAIYGEFSIDESCYIDSTGHFNAVELNICYNQLFYVLFADGVRRKAIPALHTWTLDTFQQKQLPALLITRLQSRFRKPIDARSFRAKGTLLRMRTMSNRFIFAQTKANFSDSADGEADGDADFVGLV